MTSIGVTGVMVLGGCSSGDGDVVAAKATEATEAAIHEHAAFGVWHCDRYLDDVTDRHGDRNGVHTHDDGLIHVHPTDPATRPEAVFGLFLAEVDLQLNDTELVRPDGTAIRSGDDCGGRPGRLTVQRWKPTPSGDAVAEIFTDDLTNVTLDDRSAVAIVFAPSGVVAPPPFGVYALDDLTDVALTAATGEGGTQGAGATRGPLSLPADSTTVSASPVDEPAPAALPAGTRDSFAVWVVTSTAMAPANGCAPDAVPGWGRNAELCFVRATDSTPLQADIVDGASGLKNDATGEWYVELTLTTSGLKAFNQLIQPASLADRRIAFEYGGTVLSAPSLQVDAFDTPQVNLSGPLDEQSARRLAEVLDG